VQTFLPYSDFIKTAKCLDYRRLGKQRVEAWQIYQAITNSNYGWQNHPIVNMWRGYEKCLLYYGVTICLEWIDRGYKDSILNKFLKEIIKIKSYEYLFLTPSWIGNKKFHASHRSNLLRKDKDYYGKFNWKEPDNLPYVWIK